MSNNYIEYQQYKKQVQKQSLTPRRNIFEQNRTLQQQIERLTKQTKLLQNKIIHFQNVSTALIDAIGKVFSKELAEELKGMVVLDGVGQIRVEADEERSRVGRSQDMSRTIYQMLVTHQEMMTVSDWSQSRKSGLRTPDKAEVLNSREILSYRQQSFKNSNQFSPHRPSLSKPHSPHNSVLIASTIKDNDPSTNRSSQAPVSSLIAIATGINCQLCQQTFAPNQFIDHASRCKQNRSRVSMGMSQRDREIENERISERQIERQRERDSERERFVQESMNFDTQQYQREQEVEETFGSQVLKQINMEDTHDRRLKKQSQSYLTMMNNLIKIQKQIEQQIQMIKFSKQKIDRDAQKRKLQKDLAKVMYVIQQKKKITKIRQKNKQKLRLQPSQKSSKLLKKNSTKLKN